MGLLRDSLLFFFSSPLLSLPAHHVSSVVFLCCIDSSQKKKKKNNSIWSAPEPFEVSLQTAQVERHCLQAADTLRRLMAFFIFFCLQKSQQCTSRQKTQYAEGQTQHFGTLNPDKNYHIFCKSFQTVSAPALSWFFT